MYSNFEYDKKRGKVGESAVINFFIQKGSSVKDVSEDEDFQPKGVDLIINNSEYIEVKSQNAINNKNRITLEIDTISNNGEYKEGWFLYTQSDKLVFYDSINDIAYHIDTEELKDIYYNYYNQIEKYDFKERKKTSKLAFIDLDFLKRISNSLEIYKYNTFTA